MPKKSSGNKKKVVSDTEDDIIDDSELSDNETFADDVNDNVDDTNIESYDDINDEEDDDKLNDVTIDEKQDEECLYNYLKEDDDEGEIGEDVDEEIFDEEKIGRIKLEGDDRITKPVLFSYERIRIYSDRIKQLSLSAKPMIKNVDGLDPREIAELEVKYGVCPLIIERELPNGYYEEWKVSELER